MRIHLTCFFPVIHLVCNGTCEATKRAPAYGSQAHSFLHTEGCTVGTENLSMAGDNETFAKDIFKGCHYPFVQRGASQKHHPLSYFSIAHYPVEVIMNNRIAQAPYEIFQGYAQLVIWDKVRLHENSTSFGEFDGSFCREGNILKFSHYIDSIFICQFVQKTACPCSTHLVHVKIERVSISNMDVFWVLAANLKDGIYLSVYGNRPFGVSRYLINNEVRIEKITHHIPARSSSSGSSYLNPLTEIMSYASQKALGHFYWPALGGDVRFVDDFAFFVHQSVFGCRGSNINS